MPEPKPKEFIKGMIKNGEKANRVRAEEAFRFYKAVDGLGETNQAKLARMIKRKGKREQDKD